MGPGVGVGVPLGVGVGVPPGQSEQFVPQTGVKYGVQVPLMHCEQLAAGVGVGVPPPDGVGVGVPPPGFGVPPGQAEQLVKQPEG